MRKQTVMNTTVHWMEEWTTTVHYPSKCTWPDQNYFRSALGGSTCAALIQLSLSRQTSRNNLKLVKNTQNPTLRKPAHKVHFGTPIRVCGLCLCSSHFYCGQHHGMLEQTDFNQHDLEHTSTKSVLDIKAVISVGDTIGSLHPILERCLSRHEAGEYSWHTTAANIRKLVQ